MDVTRITDFSHTTLVDRMVEVDQSVSRAGLSSGAYGQLAKGQPLPSPLLRGDSNCLKPTPLETTLVDSLMDAEPFVAVVRSYQTCAGDGNRR
jgi:hypothetical protein